MSYWMMVKSMMELNEILACLGRLIDDSDLILSFKTNELRVTSDEPVAWTQDGEFGGQHTEVTIRNLKQRVRILVDDVESVGYEFTKKIETFDE